MTKNTETIEASGNSKNHTYRMTQDDEKRSSYYVTRTADGKVLDRTRVMVPARTNLFFGKTRREKETAA